VEQGQCRGPTSPVDPESIEEVLGGGNRDSDNASELLKD
jgi:hypothetical protein